ncbi:hypothetical protein [Pseudomonas sp. PIC25]|uniref:hypothetical protein n=1 Tax=Pseudomonas sp. PIC25 TaxID=1958773 RepID=UPI00117BD0E8|nr:hypothetical protein [Pseudomonas sp. PIC25]
MTGFLLAAVFAAWLVFVVFVTRYVIRLFKSGFLRVIGGVSIFLVLLIVPLIDELVGKWQFNSLCKSYAVVQVDEEHAYNRNVFSEVRKEDRYVEGVMLKIRIDPYVYRDVDTGNVIVKYHILHAQGGWLVRFLGVSEANAPLLFEGGCAPSNRYDFKKIFGIKVVN